MSEPRVFLNVKIPGEPVAWERVKWGRYGAFDGQKTQKQTFRQEVIACCPRLKTTAVRIGLLAEIWTSKSESKNCGDYDNFAKFIGDAGNGLIWFDDSQIKDARIIVHNCALQPHLELKVWELHP